MTIEFVGFKSREHECDLPRRGPFWNRNPLCVEGNIIQCNVCGTKYVWQYWGYSETWSWDKYDD